LPKQVQREALKRSSSLKHAARSENSLEAEYLRNQLKVDRLSGKLE
jgi:hypothetical protein